MIASNSRTDRPGDPLSYFPDHLDEGITELRSCIRAISAVASLLFPAVEPAPDLDFVDRGELSALLELLARNAKWHAARAEAELNAARGVK